MSQNRILRMCAVIGIMLVSCYESGWSLPSSNSRQKAYDLFSKGADWYARGDNNKAIHYFEEALILNPRLGSAQGILIIACAEQALVLYQDGNYEQALPYLNKLLRLLPGDAEIRTIYREARAKLPAIASPVDIVDMADSLQKQYRLDWMGYVGLGKKKTALDQKQAYLEDMFVSYNGTALGTRYIDEEIGNLIKERTLFLKSLSRRERHARAMEQFQNNRPREAIFIWEELLAEKYDKDIERYLTQAQVALEGDFQRAIAEANALDDTDRLDKALAGWKRVLTLDPQEVTARLAISEIHLELTKMFNKGVSYYQDGKYTGSLDIWQKMASLYPGYRNISYYIDQAEQKIAGTEKRYVLEVIEMYIARGDVLQRQGDFIGAVKLWREALAIKPGYRTAKKRIAGLITSLSKRARLSERKGDVRKAGQIRTLIVSINPRSKKAKKKLTKTVKRTARSVRADVTAFLTEGEQLYNSGKYVQALTALKKVLKAQPKNTKAITLATESALAQGIIFYRSDKLAEAISLWEYVLVYKPGHAQAGKYKTRATLKKKSLERFQ